MVMAKHLYSHVSKDSIDAKIEELRGQCDWDDFGVAFVGGIGFATLNASIAQANLANPEPFSKTAIWALNGLVAIGCLAARAYHREKRKFIEDEIIENLKLLKAIHICMQNGLISGDRMGQIVVKLDNLKEVNQ